MQGLDDTTICAEKLYSINFTKTNTKFCLSLHYNGSNSYLFVNGTEIHKFETKDSEIVAAPICLGNISRDFSVDNMKNAGLNGYVYDFSGDYDFIANDKILDIHKYLMKKNYKMIHKFINKCLFTAMTFFSYNVLNVNSLECVSMNNQECKIRTEIINLNTNEPVFYPYNIKINRCKGSYNTINDPYAKICVPKQIKKNVKVFNLLSRTNEARHIKWHKTCKCKCKLDASICKNKQ